MSSSHSSILDSFRQDESSLLQIIDGTSKITNDNNNPNKQILLVLDSSFNPPHWGHYTLIEKAVEVYRKKSDVSIHVLLLLSIKNTDKDERPASFDKRMDMMCILSKVTKNKLEKIDVSVGLTKCAKFVDKNDAIKQKFFPFGNIIYLVGFDTITRILDPKYYLPQQLSEILAEFIENSELFCLTRKYSVDDNNSEFEEQITYSQDISNGKYEPTIPRQWGKKINIVLNENKYSSVSSSSIRKNVNSDNYAGYKDELPNEIVKYIQVKCAEDKKSLYI